MLSDEERKAIDDLFALTHINGYIDLYSQREAKIHTLDLSKWQKGVKVLLNLIEKQSKEIEHQIKKRANQKKELAILNAKQVEFNKLVNTVNSYKGQFKRQQKEIEELKTITNQYDSFPMYNKKHSIIIASPDYFYNGTFIKKFISKDKIKAKIEILEKLQKEFPNNDEIRIKIIAYKELLEKE